MTAVLIGVLVGTVPSTSAQAAPVFTEYPLPAGSGCTVPVAGPNNSAAVWYTAWAANKIGRLDPQNGHVDEFGDPVILSGPHTPIVGPDGAIWFSIMNTGRIGRIDPVNPGHIDRFTPPGLPSVLIAVENGPGGIWYTKTSGNKIGRIDPYTHQFQEFPVPTLLSAPEWVIPGPDNTSIWFNEWTGNKIGRLDLITGTTREWTVPSPNAFGYPVLTSIPSRPAFTSDGALWFPEFGTSKIGRFDPASETFTEIDTPTQPSAPLEVVVGPDRKIWFTEAVGNRIGQLDPRSPHDIVEYPVPTAASVPAGLNVGNDKDIWVCEFTGDRLLHIKP
jgi:virginiamycin B lyase